MQDADWLRNEVHVVAGSAVETVDHRLGAVRAGHALLGFSAVEPFYEAWFQVPPESLGPEGARLQEGALRLLASFANVPGQDGTIALLGRISEDPLGVLPSTTRSAAATAFFAHASAEAGRSLLLKLDLETTPSLRAAIREGLARHLDRDVAAELIQVLDGPEASPPPPPPGPED